MSTPSPISLPDGTWIDNFRIVRRLGRGGFGVTYLAEEFREWEVGGHTATPLRQVAVKEYFPRGLASRPDGQTVSLSADVDGAEQAFQMGLKGFFQEAESLMRFDHPNVIRIHRVFQRNGTAYYVMPFLKGESLKDILKREGSLSEARTRSLLLPIIDGLIHAHARGIVHRDLKPDNVMVPEEGAPLLIDFGAARAQAIDDVSDYTRYSELVAYSPGYAALEQYGRATRENPHGPQTDVYGIAAVMYHCVVGTAPPEASLRSMRLSSGDQDPIVPASVKLMDVPGFSRAFLAAIDWGLELASRNRPATLTEFRRALDGNLDLPANTQARLERHGVSTESFTRPVAFAPTSPLTMSAGFETQRLTRRAHEPSSATDTVMFTTPSISRTTTGASRAASPTQMASAGADEPTELLPPAARPTTPARPADDSSTMLIRSSASSQPLRAEPRPTPPPAEPVPARGRMVLPIVALVVSLLALGYIGRGTILGLLDGKAPDVQPPPAPLTPKPALAPSAIAPPPAPETAAPPSSAVSPGKAEREAFEAAKQTDSIAGWTAFEKAFPDSALRATAEIRIAALRAKPAAPEAQVAPERPAAPPAGKTPVPAAPGPSPTSTPEASRELAAPAPVILPATPAAAPAPVVATAPKMREGGFRDCELCPELVRVGGGSFQMGDAAGDGEEDERPLHAVSIAALNVGRYEVSFDEWGACAAAGACQARSAGASEGRNPVNKVNWDDVQAYLAWLSRTSGKHYRLPSEAEFEYLNRAGTSTVFPWSAQADASACKYANVADERAKARHPEMSTFACDDGYSSSSPVGSFQGNAFGLFDMAGNVWEWTQDCYGPYTAAAGNGKPQLSGDCGRRVIRGGAWSEGPAKLRAADRSWSLPSGRLNVLGFRVVRD